MKPRSKNFIRIIKKYRNKPKQQELTPIPENVEIKKLPPAWADGAESQLTAKKRSANNNRDYNKSWRFEL